MNTIVDVDRRWAESGLPALVSASAPADLTRWLTEHADHVQDLALTHGAVLFRGFGIADDVAFRAVMDALSGNLAEYGEHGERSSPRTRVSAGVYTSTEYPATERILPHNEQSYADNWPMKIVFCCKQPATVGGATPLLDSRKVLARLRPETVSAFEEHGVLYQRNYLPGISLTWQDAFQTDERVEVDAYCARVGITNEWVSEDHLRTTQVRRAVHEHPVTGDRTWFNHAHFFNVRSLPEEVRDGLLDALDESDLPYQTYFGNGEPIPVDVLDEIAAAMEAERTSFAWQAGDVLVVENMITAHARDAYEGPRMILTAMADPVKQEVSR